MAALAVKLPMEDADFRITGRAINQTRATLMQPSDKPLLIQCEGSTVVRAEICNLFFVQGAGELLQRRAIYERLVEERVGEVPLKTGNQICRFKCRKVFQKRFRNRLFARFTPHHKLSPSHQLRTRVPPRIKPRAECREGEVLLRLSKKPRSIGTEALKKPIALCHELVFGGGDLSSKRLNLLG